MENKTINAHLLLNLKIPVTIDIPEGCGYTMDSVLMDNPIVLDKLQRVLMDGWDVEKQEIEEF